MKKNLIALSLTAALSACGGNSGTEQSQSKFQAPPLPTQKSQSAPVTNQYTYSAKRSNYALCKTVGGTQIADLINPGYKATLNAATSILFSDVNVNLMIADKATTISAKNLQSLIELYVAFFNRVPDADGLSYWIDQVQGGMTIEQIADSFYQAALQDSAVTGYSASMSNADFVKIIYTNVLGRSGTTAPPDADVNYWASQLSSGQSSKGNLVATMLNAAHTYAGDAQWGWVPKLLDNKVSVARYFSIEQGLSYLTRAASISQGMAIAKAVTSTDTVAAKQLIGISDTSYNNACSVDNGNTGNTTAGLNEALNVFAESWTALKMVSSFYDLTMLAGNTTNCPRGGTLSTTQAGTVMNNCVRRISVNNNAYQGILTGSINQIGTVKTVNLQNSQAISVNLGGNPGVTQYVMKDTNIAGTLTSTEDNSGYSTDVTQISGNASFSLNSNNVYSATGIGGTATDNNGNNVTISNGFFYTHNSGSENRLVNSSALFFNVNSSGVVNYPVSGKYSVAVGGSGTRCVNVSVQFLNQTQIKISCDASQESRILNSTDADLNAALSQAQK